MPFDNPYFATQFDIGDLAHGHMHFDAAGATFYAPDGVTPNFHYDAATGAISLTGTLSVASVVPGSTVTGSVANANNATLAATATNSTNAINLTGGGTAAGQTTISGSLVVGTPGGLNSWAVVGVDGSGADGFRLYKTGVNVIDLNIAGTPTITGAQIQTATSGGRIVLDGSGIISRESILFYNGTVDPPTGLTRVYPAAGTDAGGNAAPSINIEAGAIASPTGLNGAGIRLTAATVSGQALIEYGTTGAQNSGATHKFYGGVSIAAGSVVTNKGLDIAGNLDVSGNVGVAGAVAAPIGVAHLEVKNGVGDLASVGIAVQAIAGQTGAMIETFTTAGTRSTSIDDVTGINTIRAVCVGDNSVNQVRIWGTSGVPPASLGADGDFAFRWGNITTAGQRLYWKWAGAWNATAV